MAEKMNRRELLKTVGIGAGAVALPILVPGKAQAQQGVTHGVLVDTRRCVNCKSCQISCKAWNDNQLDPTTFKTSFSESTWTYVQEDESGVFPTVEYVVTKRQCMHCEDPVCVESCPMDGLAIHKESDGPVLVDHTNCVRCLACVRNCPYGVPKFDSQEDKIAKCVFCFGRLRDEQQPACVNTCVAGALQAGTLEAITTLAEAAVSDGYPVYGLDSGWETSWIYVFPKGVDPDDIMFPNA